MYGNVEGSNYWMIKTFLISYFIHFYFYSESMTAVMFMEGHVRGQWGKVFYYFLHDGIKIGYARVPERE